MRLSVIVGYPLLVKTAAWCLSLCLRCLKGVARGRCLPLAGRSRSPCETRSCLFPLARLPVSLSLLHLLIPGILVLVTASSLSFPRVLFLYFPSVTLLIASQALTVFRHSFRHHYIPLGLDPRTRVSTTKRPTTNDLYKFTIRITPEPRSTPTARSEKDVPYTFDFSTFKHPNPPIHPPELLYCNPLLRQSHPFDETRASTPEAFLYQTAP